MLLRLHEYQKARGGAMQDPLNVRYLKILTPRRGKPGIQPFGRLPVSQTLRDKWLPLFSQNIDRFFLIHQEHQRISVKNIPEREAFVYKLSEKEQQKKL